jgi:hypothetical protein
MPTLNNFNTFNFHRSVKITPEIQALIENNKSINIILSILATKFQKATINNRVYFFKGRTGSGKSSLFIASLFKYFNSTILVSEPRILLVTSNAKVIGTFNPELLPEINTITSNYTLVESTHRSITMMTTAILYMQLLNILMLPVPEQMTKLKNYKFIIIDEVHMIDLHVIRLLYICKQILKNHGSNPCCPMFIFQSATIDLRTLIFYILEPKDELEYKILIKDPYLIGYVKGEANYEIKEDFIDNDEMYKYNNTNEPYSRIVANYVTRLSPAPKESKFIVNNKKITCKDILILVPLVRSINDILEAFPRNVFKVSQTSTIEQVIKWRKTNYNTKRIIAIGYARNYSAVSDMLMTELINPDSLSEDILENETHIIVSTPILDTGLTLPLLYYCVDLGIQNSLIYKPLTMNLTKLGKYFKQIPVSISDATQRVGRLGRINIGHFVHFYSNKAYKQFMKNNIPETINNFSISPTILSQMKQVTNTFHYFDLTNTTPLLYPPSIDILLNTARDLIYAGYFTAFSLYIPIQSYLTEDWESYAIFMHLHIHQPLFKALIFCACNRQFLYPTLNPQYLEKLPIDNEIIERSDTASSIRRARNVLTQILYDPKKKVPYIKSRIWE